MARPHKLRDSPYGLLRELYPIHHKHFLWMMARSKWCGGTDLVKDKGGLLSFIEEIGPVPVMKRLSVGRKDHSKGYVTGNYEWQEFSDNVREMSVRNGCSINGQTTEARRKISAKLLGHTVSPETRQKMSESHRRRSKNIS